MENNNPEGIENDSIHSPGNPDESINTNEAPPWAMEDIPDSAYENNPVDQGLNGGDDLGFSNEIEIVNQPNLDAARQALYKNKLIQDEDAIEELSSDFKAEPDEEIVDEEEIEFESNELDEEDVDPLQPPEWTEMEVPNSAYDIDPHQQSEVQAIQEQTVDIDDIQLDDFEEVTQRGIENAAKVISVEEDSNEVADADPIVQPQPLSLDDDEFAPAEQINDEIKDEVKQVIIDELNPVSNPVSKAKHAVELGQKAFQQVNQVMPAVDQHEVPQSVRPRFADARVSWHRPTMSSIKNMFSRDRDGTADTQKHLLGNLNKHVNDLTLNQMNAYKQACDDISEKSQKLVDNLSENQDFDYTESLENIKRNYSYLDQERRSLERISSYNPEFKKQFEEINSDFANKIEKSANQFEEQTGDSSLKEFFKAIREFFRKVFSQFRKEEPNQQLNTSMEP